MNKQLEAYLQSLSLDDIDPSRKEVLGPLISYLRKHPKACLNFICTHNSRRSQFAQVWAQVAAYFYGIQVEAFSGGLEITACNPRTVSALERSGLTLSQESQSSNPHYKLTFSAEAPSLNLFSKLYDDAANPQSDFAAVMTCSHADENCPFIPGAQARIALNYEDPKAFDDQPGESEAYDQRCAQIATEMLYVFKSVK